MKNGELTTHHVKADQPWPLVYVESFKALTVDEFTCWLILMSMLDIMKAPNQLSQNLAHQHHPCIPPNSFVSFVMFWLWTRLDFYPIDRCYTFLPYEAVDVELACERRWFRLALYCCLTDFDFLLWVVACCLRCFIQPKSQMRHFGRPGITIADLVTFLKHNMWINTTYVNEPIKITVPPLTWSQATKVSFCVSYFKVYHVENL